MPVNVAFSVAAYAGPPLGVAALLGSALAWMPNRAPRRPSILESQILLALIGAVVVLIVGDSLGRAVGAAALANLVRYRVAVKDPRDAAVAARKHTARGRAWPPRRVS